MFAGFEGATLTDVTRVDMYVPGDGLWPLSLSPLKSALDAKVKLNRVSFKMDGHAYTGSMAAPLAREEDHIWVLHNPKYELGGTSPFIRSIDLGRYIESSANDSSR